jgi:hypothetical protein
MTFKDFYICETHWEGVEDKLVKKFPKYSDIIRKIFKIKMVRNWFDKAGIDATLKSLVSELSAEEQQQGQGIRDRLLKGVKPTAQAFDDVQWEELDINGVELIAEGFKPKVFIYALMLFLSSLISNMDASTGGFGHDETQEKTPYMQVMNRNRTVA